ncbi:MAG: biotin--[acetyl-CoA-carboxylase] ligase [Shimia sp.]
MNTWPLSYGRIVLSSVDSTMEEARRQAPNVSQPTWILALDQSAARGRRGRAWRHPKGNFAATLVVRAEDPRQAALRSFVASLALHDTFEALRGRADGLSLKWPNDVLLNGGKVAGILLESLPGGWLAIGIGVNLAEAPGAAEVEEGATPPVKLDLDPPAAPEAFLDLLALFYDKRERAFTTYGFGPIRTAWLARAARLGQPIRARTTRETHHGTFRDVDHQGQLVLETPKGRLTIPAADVYF